MIKIVRKFIFAERQVCPSTPYLSVGFATGIVFIKLKHK